MGKINVGRVILGGLVAGVVINIGEFILNEPILGTQWIAAMESLNRPPMEGSMIVWFSVMSFILGISMVWVYAAIRPRFGPGPKTAVVAGLTVWFFAWLWGFGSTWVMGLFPAGLVGITLAWGLVESCLATAAGAWLYKEPEPSL
jgi:hypothetical protein